MADNILQFQSGREAAIMGDPRDARRTADWLEGYDMEAGRESPPGECKGSDNG